MFKSCPSIWSSFKAVCQSKKPNLASKKSLKKNWRYLLRTRKNTYLSEFLLYLSLTFNTHCINPHISFFITPQAPPTVLTQVSLLLFSLHLSFFFFRFWNIIFAAWPNVKVAFIFRWWNDDYWLTLVITFSNISEKVSIYFVILLWKLVLENNKKRTEALNRMLHCTNSFIAMSHSSQQSCEVYHFLNHISQMKTER